MRGLLDGPVPQVGVGVVASFDFDRDRELWRWAPDDVSLFIARTDPVSSADNLGLVSALNQPGRVERPTREVCAVGARAVTYLCTACGFVGGPDREHALREAMLGAGAPRALTTAGAVVDALRAVGARRVAVAHPYEPPVGERLREFLTESELRVVSSTDLGLGSIHEVYDVSYARVAELIRAGDHPDADALFVSCTALPTYDLIAPLEQELGKPIITANQATIWAVLRTLGIAAIGPEQTLLGVT
ncbi:maleate cis-trans isomerase family protein [Amycolatopsis anabasis]|uniref:maleate cis-trans isomerase family protein n=1 Tax=Amycolatopsis anabasis TaxID=1840409 RepID=UPI00131C874F|nr:Asp/Glu racemase [Amycolatopsis anabasis]